MKTIFYNGKVYTGSLPLVSAFSVENGIFHAVGSDEELLSSVTYADETVDLHGKFVCAGFNDSHMHILNYGYSLHCVPMADYTQSLSRLLEGIREFSRNHPLAPGQWLIGRGWNQDYFTDVHRMPSRQDLDQVSTEIPICIVRCCGHCLVVNSKALDLLGITEDTISPEGGSIGQENGRLDGRFYDNAMSLVYSRIPLPDKKTLKEYVRSACKELNRCGVTSSQSDDYSVFRQLPWQTVNEVFRELEAEGELTVRVYEQSNFENLETLKEFVEAGNKTGTGTDFFRIGPLKMLGDGSLGARTAYMTVPYADDPSTIGIPVFTPKEFQEMISYAHSQDMQVAVHTIGDACLDDVLFACEKALAEYPKKDHRHGIVHCQITRPDQLEKIAALGMHVYAQTIFLDYDIHIVEDRVGKDRASTSYSWKTLMKNGVSVSNGTDCPVELPRALSGMQCAVTRRTLDGKLGPYLPEQAFTIQEALDSYTIRSSEASFEEKVKGLIQPGYMADFVILDDDLFEADSMTIKDIPVYQTWVNGKKVFG